MTCFGLKWPYTGRPAPPDAEIRVHHIHAPWADLMWHNPTRNLWVYLSTLPIGQVPAELITKEEI